MENIHTYIHTCTYIYIIFFSRYSVGSSWLSGALLILSVPQLQKTQFLRLSFGNRKNAAPSAKSSNWISIFSSLSVKARLVLQNLSHPASWDPAPILKFQLSIWEQAPSQLSPPSSLALENYVLSVVLRSLSQALFYFIYNPRTFFLGNHKWCLVHPQYFRF